MQIAAIGIDSGAVYSHLEIYTFIVELNNATCRTQNSKNNCYMQVVCINVQSRVI